jgi:hypothetical protein
MTNTYTMALNLQDAEYRKKALFITGGFIVFAILLLIFLKWKLPEIEKVAQETGIEVELNLPPDPPPPPVEENDGGGGGGNPVQAAGDPGVAPPTPPAPGEEQDSKDLDDNDKEETPPITKPIAVNKEAKTINNKSTPTATPRPVEVPAPPRPKAVLGKTTTGTGRGGGADDYDKAGGSGTGSGVGNGSGTGGGSGTGSGGGNGSGTGGGSGPKVVRGDRKIVRSYSFTGDLEKATVYANVSVSPEGVGTLISLAKGSTNTSLPYKQEIQRYLQNIRFDKSDHESMLTVQFNFRVN